MSDATTTAPRAFLLLGQAGERQFHNRPAHWASLAALLRGADLRARAISDDPADLNPANLARYDVILSFASSLPADEGQVAALRGAVEGGIGFVGLHGATTSFRDSADYVALIGGRFSHHPPLGPYTVERLDPEHPITAGLAPFTLEDELYHLTDVAADIEVLAWAGDQPMVYVRQQGAGRVCYIAPGHDQRALDRPEYAQLVHRAIAWAARRGA